MVAWGCQTPAGDMTGDDGSYFAGQDEMCRESDGTEISGRVLQLIQVTNFYAHDREVHCVLVLRLDSERLPTKARFSLSGSRCRKLLDAGPPSQVTLRVLDHHVCGLLDVQSLVGLRNARIVYRTLAKTRCAALVIPPHHRADSDSLRGGL